MQLLPRDNAIFCLDRSAARQLESVLTFIHREPAKAARRAERMGPPKPRENTPKGSVAVVPVYGFISHHASIYGRLCGGTSCDEVMHDVSKCLSHPGVDGIILDVDSPGGESAGVQECADFVRQSSKVKPIWACSNSMAASAAYWLACSAGKFCCTPSGDVGSVGVYAMHVDYSKAMADAGVQVSFVHAGKWKVEGNPYEPLGDEARAYFQEQVNSTYSSFVKSIAKFRDTTTADVLAAYGQGRIVGARQAKAAGMVDAVEDIGASWDALATALGKKPKNPGNGLAGLAALRNDYRALLRAN